MGPSLLQVSTAAVPRIVRGLHAIGGAAPPRSLTSGTMVSSVSRLPTVTLMSARPAHAGLVVSQSGERLDRSSVKAATRVAGLRTGVSALALAASGLVMAADAPAARNPAAQVQPAQELDEVLVEGRRIREKRPSWNDYQQSFNFLGKRLNLDPALDAMRDAYASHHHHGFRRLWPTRQIS